MEKIEKKIRSEKINGKLIRGFEIFITDEEQYLKKNTKFEAE
jgi:hypothetical protein